MAQGDENTVRTLLNSQFVCVCVSPKKAKAGRRTIDESLRLDFHEDRHETVGSASSQAGQQGHPQVDQRPEDDGQVRTETKTKKISTRNLRKGKKTASTLRLAEY